MQTRLKKSKNTAIWEPWYESKLLKPAEQPSVLQKAQDEEHGAQPCQGQVLWTPSPLDPMSPLIYAVGEHMWSWSLENSHWKWSKLNTPEHLKGKFNLQSSRGAQRDRAQGQIGADHQRPADRSPPQSAHLQAMG